MKDRISNAILVANRKQSQIAVCAVDVDDFKTINDSFGHQAGDDVLKKMTQRLVSELREYDSMARVGGDEFVILLQEVVDRNQVSAILDRILNATTLPLEVGGHAINPTLSIGVALYPEHGKDTVELTHSADKALYHSKTHGKNRYSFYAPQEKQRMVDPTAHPGSRGSSSETPLS